MTLIILWLLWWLLGLWLTIHCWRWEYDVGVGDLVLFTLVSMVAGIIGGLIMWATMAGAEEKVPKVIFKRRRN